LEVYGIITIDVLHIRLLLAGYYVAKKDRGMEGVVGGWDWLEAVVGAGFDPSPSRQPKRGDCLCCHRVVQA
jgi:hypothetical protein